MSRKSIREKVPRVHKREVEVPGDGQGFQDRLLGMLEWLADKDPVKAARLIGEYLDELTDELQPGPKPAKN